MPQKIFKTAFVSKAAKHLESLNARQIVDFAKSDFGYSEADTLTTDQYPDLSDLSLRNKAKDGDFQFENAIALHERLRITPYQASDPRLWAYLASVTFRPYMNNLRPLTSENTLFFSKTPQQYVISHYLCRSSSIKDLLLHDIALLWWIPEMTVSDIEEDKYRLTKEVFSMLDYTRHLLPGIQGRSSTLRHAVLDYVVNNPDLFSRFKAEKVRLIMRRLNLKAGVQLFPVFTHTEIKDVIDSFRQDIAKCSE